MSILNKFVNAQTIPPQGTSDEDYDKWESDNNISGLKDEIRSDSEQLIEYVQHIRSIVLSIDGHLAKLRKAIPADKYQMYQGAMNEFNNYTYTIEQFEEELKSVVQKLNGGIQ